MKLQPPSAPLDAFFAPVRRRHPDVDLVVLPAPEPTPSREPWTRRRWSRPSSGSATPPSGWEKQPSTRPPRPRPGWASGRTRAPSSRRSAPAPRRRTGFEALVALRAALEGEGWRVRRLPGAVERLSGVRGDLRVHASYAEEHGRAPARGEVGADVRRPGPGQGAGEALMEVVPLSVGRVSRSWDEQALDVSGRGRPDRVRVQRWVHGSRRGRRRPVHHRLGAARDRPRRGGRGPRGRAADGDRRLPRDGPGRRRRAAGAGELPAGAAMSTPLECSLRSASNGDPA